MKYNLSNIARRANALTATMNQSAAWKQAWAEEKMANAESALFILEMKDRWNDTDRAEAAALRQEIAKQQATINPIRVVEAPRKELTWEEQMEAILNATKDDPYIRNLCKAA